MKVKLRLERKARELAPERVASTAFENGFRTASPPPGSKRKTAKLPKGNLRKQSLARGSRRDSKITPANRTDTRA